MKDPNVDDEKRPNDDGETATPAPQNPLASFLENVEEATPEPSADAVARAAIFGDSMPQDAAAAVQPKQKTAHPKAGIPDAFGTPFDPEVHAQTKEGEPSVTSVGRYRKKRGASRIETGARPAAQAQPIQPGTPTPEQIAQATATGHVIADLILWNAEALGGQDWKPKSSPDERLMMRDAWARYCVAQGMTDMPPWAQLSLAMGSYAIPRLLTSEETQTKLGRVGEKIKNGAAYVRGFFKGKKSNGNAHPDSGNNGERQVPSSETDSGGKEGDRARRTGT